MLILRTKLFETILAMKVSERDRIPDFISSPIFFVKEEKILELYILLRKEIEKYENGEKYAETEEEIYNLLSPNKKWNQKTFDSMESRLLNVIKKAIIYQYATFEKFRPESLSEEEEVNIEIKQLLLLAKFYRERKLNQQFDNTINRIKALQNGNPYSNDYYVDRFNAAFEEYEIASLYRLPDRNEKRLMTLESLDLGYIVYKLAILLQSEPPIKEEIEQQILNLEKLSIKQDIRYQKIITIYRKAFNVIWYKEEDDETILDEYLTILENDIHLLPFEHQKNLYTCARNFCTAQYKKGKNHQLKILFELIKKNLKTGFLYFNNGAQNEGILFGAVQNTVAIALKLQESDWVLSFLQAHKTRILAPNAAEQERFYNFNLACYHFHRKEYDEALNLLNTDFDDDRYRLVARALEIKLYFDKADKKDKEIDFFENRIAAFETYLSRTDMPNIDKTGYRNFIKIIKKMNKFKQVTTQDLEEKNSIAEREWIVEKVSTLNEKKKKQGQ